MLPPTMQKCNIHFSTTTLHNVDAVVLGNLKTFRADESMPQRMRLLCMPRRTQ